jgi:hypothetical protein
MNAAAGLIMNRLEMEDFLYRWGWTVETWFSRGTMFVAHRGMELIIGYPKSNKYREGSSVRDGLMERLVKKRKEAEK